MSLHFSDITAVRPSEETLAQDYGEINALLDQDNRAEAIALCDRKSREYQTWASLVGLRFSQNTADATAKADREYADALAPKIADHDVAFKRRLLSDRAGLDDLVGAHAVNLWEVGVTTFDPVIASDLEEESALCARYTELSAGAKLTIAGQTVNLSGVAPFAESLDRDIRHEAQQARWDFYAAHSKELDKIYDDLVKLRHSMAIKLGYKTYTPLAYQRMSRVDYNDRDVARYRDQVASEVVPLVQRGLEARRKKAGWDRLYFWDEGLTDLEGNPKPAGGHDLLVDRARTMFRNIDSRLADFYDHMIDGGFTDLKNRDGKAIGGFCTSFPTTGAPYIFANFNGTFHDIDVFTHEMGHAFQAWQSRDQPLIDYQWPTMEAAEINSMSLEFLSHPHIDPMLEAGMADRYRHMHLTNALEFLPYGVCVDHFQHEVYARPDMTPAERHAVWHELERRYMPWTDYGDIAYPEKGGRWQAKRHIYYLPFYYIDYTLALCCAMQFWVKSRNDYGAAMEAYVALCARGGSAPFQDLVKSAGLVSPFADGALSDVVREAEAVLGV